MPRLHLAFHDGFTDEPVVVRVGGREVFRDDHMKTRTQLSFAGAFETDVANGPAEIEVTLPARPMTGTTTVDPGTTGYVAISAYADGIRWRTSTNPFGYA
jgi:hypothetical protein